MRLRQFVALLGIAVSLAGLAINFWIIVASAGAAPPARSLPATLVYFWTFFTHLTNLALCLFYLADLWPVRGLAWLRLPLWRASMAGFITLVMLFYHFMLAPNYYFTGGLLVSNVLMHYVAPVLFLIWWGALIPHGTLRYADIPLMLAPGIVYVAWVLLRGAVVNEYPYAILDVGKAGVGRVAIGVLILLALVAVFCAILVFIDRRLGRRRTAATAP